MKFSAHVLALTIGFVPSVNGFISPTTNAVVLNQEAVASKFGVVSNTHVRTCKCPACGSNTKLFMSEEPVDDEVPAEVAVLDGVADETEAHNVDRPARASGLHKHSKSPKETKPLSEFSVGSMVEGKVKTITPYGAFIDIGASTDALLHVSRMSDDFVSNVEDIVKVGETVNVRIGAIDEEKKQVSLSMRSEEADNEASRPGGKQSARRTRPNRSGGDREAQREAISKLAAMDLSEEKFVEGEVVSTLSFGAFVRFDTSQFDAELYSGEVDGLVHISALTAGRVSNVEDVVKAGDKVQIRVKAVDPEGGKVSLSMITKEVEEASGKQQNRGGGGGRGKSLFKASEMGPSDWKEQMERVLADQGAFANLPIIVDKRK